MGFVQIQDSYNRPTMTITTIIQLHYRDLKKNVKDYLIYRNFKEFLQRILVPEFFQVFQRFRFPVNEIVA